MAVILGRHAQARDRLQKIKGIGFQIAKDLVAHGFTVLVGSRNLERGESAAKEVGPDARALQLDVTDQASIAAAAERVRSELGYEGGKFPVVAAWYFVC